MFMMLASNTLPESLCIHKSKRMLNKQCSSGLFKESGALWGVKEKSMVLRTVWYQLRLAYRANIVYTLWIAKIPNLSCLKRHQTCCHTAIKCHSQSTIEPEKNFYFGLASWKIKWREKTNWKSELIKGREWEFTAHQRSV